MGGNYHGEPCYSCRACQWFQIRLINHILDSVWKLCQAWLFCIFLSFWCALFIILWKQNVSARWRTKRVSKPRARPFVRIWDICRLSLSSKPSFLWDNKTHFVFWYLHLALRGNFPLWSYFNYYFRLFQGYLKSLGMARTAEVKRDARIGKLVSPF